MAIKKLETFDWKFKWKTIGVTEQWTLFNSEEETKTKTKQNYNNYTRTKLCLNFMHIFIHKEKSSWDKNKWHKWAFVFNPEK